MAVNRRGGTGPLMMNRRDGLVTNDGKMDSRAGTAAKRIGSRIIIGKSDCRSCERTVDGWWSVDLRRCCDQLDAQKETQTAVSVLLPTQHLHQLHAGVP